MGPSLLPKSTVDLVINVAPGGTVPAGEHAPFTEPSTVEV